MPLARSTSALAGALLACVAAAQKPAADKLPKWRIDPYTQNKPENLAKLGYVSYGPFEFGQRGEKLVTTADVDAHLSYEQILWVETAHLRIGSMLGRWSVPTDPDVGKKLRGEFERLRAKSGLDTFPVKTRTLDPWLRLHLLALRLEEHYALLSDWLGVKDSDFPKNKSDVIIGGREYMGMGPFMGQPGKFLILVSDAAGSMSDYLKNFTGRDTQYGQRWNFKLPGSLIYGIATEMDDGHLEHDTALHANLVFNLTHNMLDGYRFYSYETPVWIKVGLAHYFERLINEKWNTFDMNEASPADARNQWRWQPETRQLITSGKYAPFSEAYTWRDYGQVQFNDHVVIWSRWDYLMTLGKEKFGKFMKGVKGRVDPKTWMPDDSDLLGATRTALQEAYGLSPLNIDERWKEWVLATYSTQ